MQALANGSELSKIAAMDHEQALKHLNSRVEGLGHAEAKARLQRFGKTGLLKAGEKAY